MPPKKTAKGKGAEFWAALDRVVSHAEAHGDVYDGASADHATIRAGMAGDTEAEAALTHDDDEDDDDNAGGGMGAGTDDTETTA